MAKYLLLALIVTLNQQKLATSSNSKCDGIRAQFSARELAYDVNGYAGWGLAGKEEKIVGRVLLFNWALVFPVLEIQQLLSPPHRILEFVHSLAAPRFYRFQLGSVH